MTGVKICGVTSESAIATAASAGADAVGLLCSVTVETPRELAAERAATLADTAPPFLSTVLVTMAPPAEAARLVERVRPAAVQVHGYGPADVEDLRDRTTTRVLAAADADEPDAIPRIAAAADGVVVDSVDADGAGGTGEPHDWAATAGLVADLETPVILAGGLTPASVAQAVETVRPAAVDVSSGVEERPGEKDPTAVAAFVAAVRGVEARTAP